MLYLRQTTVWKTPKCSLKHFCIVNTSIQYSQNKSTCYDDEMVMQCFDRRWQSVYGAQLQLTPFRNDLQSLNYLYLMCLRQSNTMCQ